MKTLLATVLFASLFPSDPWRVSVQMHSATQDLIQHHDVVRFVKWTRHALLPGLDKPHDPKIYWTAKRWEQYRSTGR